MEYVADTKEIRSVVEGGGVRKYVLTGTTFYVFYDNSFLCNVRSYSRLRIATW